MIVTLNFQVAAVTFVTHQTLVPLSKLLLEVRDNGLPVVRILTALFFIKTNDIATIVYPDFLYFKRGWILGVAALRNALNPWIFAAEHRQINFLLATHPYPDNVADRWITAFKCLQRFLAHHPTIGHHIDFAHPDSLPHPLDNWYQGRHVGRVAGPHLTANRATPPHQRPSRLPS